MKPSRPKEERIADTIDKGLAADRLITDAVVLAWFKSEEKRLVEAMLSAGPTDDELRRSVALDINARRALKRYLENTSTMGRAAAKHQEKAKENG